MRILSSNNRICFLIVILYFVIGYATIEHRSMIHKSFNKGYEDGFDDGVSQNGTIIKNINFDMTSHETAIEFTEDSKIIIAGKIIVDGTKIIFK